MMAVVCMAVLLCGVDRGIQPTTLIRPYQGKLMVRIR